MDIQRSKDYLLKEVMLSFTLSPSTASEKPQLTKQKPSLQAKSGLVSENDTSSFGLNPRQISMMKSLMAHPSEVVKFKKTSSHEHLISVEYVQK